MMARIVTLALVLGVILPYEGHSLRAIRLYRRMRPSMGTTNTLYKATDPLTQLHYNNFSQTLTGRDYVYFVEFYASWCGHCQNFAPKWKKLAVDVKDWKKVIRLGALACSHPANTATCQRQQIKGYPTLKFFKPNSRINSNGIVFHEDEGHDVVSLRHGMIDFVEKHHQSSWPILEALPTLHDTWLRRTSISRHVFIVVDNPDEDKYLGREVILDLSAFYPQILLRRILFNDSKKYDVPKAPALYEMDRDGQITLVLSSNDRHTIVEKIRGIIGAVRLTTAAPQTTSPANQQPTNQGQKTVTADGLHMQDLESHIRYSFWSEVGQQLWINGSTLHALKDHVRIMAEYHPGKQHVVKFLKKVDEWLQNVTGSLGGQQWLHALNSLESSDAHIPTKIQWTGCSGSRPRFRGYPCSIWMTYHALTVSALEHNLLNTQYSPMKVLGSMRGYIKNFFGCRECAEHFAKMAVTMETSVHDRGDGVIWLWKSHNRVNRRLHGDRTEDPIHPKIQFPSYKKCSDCHLHRPVSPYNMTQWQNGHVLFFLRKFYGKQNIINDAVAYKWTQGSTG